MTRAEKLLAAFGGLDDAFVLEAAPPDAFAAPAPAHAPKRRRVWLRWGALAACAVVLLYAGYRVALPAATGGLSAANRAAGTQEAMEENAAAALSEEAMEESADTALLEEAMDESAGAALPEEAAAFDAAPAAQSETPAATPCPEAAAAVGTATDLPLLEPGVNESGSGNVALLEYSADELENGNPWAAATEAERAALAAMPVYQNTAYTESGLPLGLNEQQMTALAENAAAALGVSVTGVTPQTVGDISAGTGLPEDAVWQLTAKTSGQYQLEVDASGLVTVWMDELYGNTGLALPEGYAFTYTADAQSAADALEYLLKEFSALTGLRQPTAALSGDHLFDGAMNRSYAAYDADAVLADVDGASLAGRTVSYSLEKVTFAPNDSGSLMLIRKQDALAAAEHLGDYPIITAQEAETLLKAGWGLKHGNGPVAGSPGSDDPDGTPDIARVELIYRADSAVLMPWYRFYVETDAPENAADGLKNYRVYDVPAVAQEYLTQMPQE